MATGTTPTQASLAPVPDATLAAGAQDGDVEAFQALIQRHAGLMRAYAARIVGSVSEADDVVQNAFLIAWRQLDTLRDPAAVKAWFMRITSREAYAWVKKRPPEVHLDGYDTTQQERHQPESTAIRNAQLAALSAALDTLTEEQRRCWLLREVAELSYAEIAEEMDTPPSTVRGLLSRARASLTIQMEGWR
jgi:RNA polymerase sigma-70 factor (ECF subfamily)